MQSYVNGRLTRPLFARRSSPSNNKQTAKPGASKQQASLPSPSAALSLLLFMIKVLFLGLMAVERVASASVTDVTQTDSTTTMPVALARRAEDDTRTRVRESRAQCDALQPAHHGIAHNSLQSVCLRWADCSTVPGQGSVSYTRVGGQPAQSPEAQSRRQVNSQHPRTKRQTVTAAMLPDTATQTQDCSTAPGQGSVSYTRAGGQPAQRASRGGKSTVNTREPNAKP
jgi:hypothetical protein